MGQGQPQIKRHTYPQIHFLGRGETATKTQVYGTNISY